MLNSAKSANLVAYVILIVLPSISGYTFSQAENVSLGAKKTTSTIAVVNGQIISKEELDAVASEIFDQATPVERKALKKNMLDVLINQALVLQAAKTGQSLDAVDSKRLDYLINKAKYNFYLNKMGDVFPRQPLGKFDEYIQHHDKFFQNRKTYHFIRYKIWNKSPGTELAIKQLVDKDGMLSDLTAWLDDQNIRFVRNNNWQGTDQILPETLTLLEGMKNNQVDIRISPNKDLIYVTYLLGIYSDPINISDGRSLVEQEVAKIYINKSIESKLQALRLKANIKVSDEFIEEISN